MEVLGINHVRLGTDIVPDNITSAYYQCLRPTGRKEENVTRPLRINSIVILKQDLIKDYERNNKLK